MQILTARPLTKADFTPFGDVVETEGREPIAINKGFALRFTDLCRIDADAADGRSGLSIFDAKPRSLPLRLDLMERHPLGSQAFVPLSSDPFVVVVAKGDNWQISDLEAFVTNGRQGVNYARNVWHHPLLAMVPQRFVVVDRLGSGANLEVRPIEPAVAVAVL